MGSINPILTENPGAYPNTCLGRFKGLFSLLSFSRWHFSFSSSDGQSSSYTSDIFSKMLFFIVMRLSNHCQDINYVHRIVRLSAWTKYLHMIDGNEHVLRKLNFSVTIMYSLFYYVSKPSIHVVFFLLKTCVIIIIDGKFLWAIQIPPQCAYCFIRSIIVRCALGSILRWAI